MKSCSKCNVAKPESEFRRDSSKASGFKSRCKLCLNRVSVAGFPNAAAFEQDEKLYEEIEDGGTGLIAFGLPMERASAEALLSAGSVATAAIELGITPQALRAHLGELQRRAAKRGWAPANDMNKATAGGFHVKGTSTQYDAEGNIISQWVKTQTDGQAKFEQLLDAMSMIADRWTGMADPVALQPGVRDDDLLNVFPMGDPHIGMFSWSPETGNNFDLKIAEQNLFAAADQLVSLAPPAKRALVVNLGDFFHADGKGNTTTAGTPVDVDGRWAKVIGVGIRVMRRIIERCLEKHDEVHVVCEIGNHDAHMSVMLALCLAQFYENEPRVTIDTSPAKFHWYRFGQNLIGITHGDTAKAKDLPGIMACDRAKDWGETQHRIWLCGHVHHDTVKEYPGVTVETFRTLAPADAWHSGQGYRSGRDSKLIVLHREWGEVQRHTVGIRKLTAAIGQ